MAVLRAALVALMVHRTAAVATTLANCQSACNLGEMLCLNKNASSTLCSAVQGACMAGCYASHVDCGCADASVTHCVEIELQAPHANDAALTPWTRGRIFHTGYSLREGVRTQAPLRRNARLAGREFVRASGGRPGQAMPPNGVAEDPLTNGGPREPKRPPPGPRVAAASRGRLRARAAGEPARVPPGGDARSRCFGLGGKCCLSTCARSLDTCFGE